MSTRTLWQDLYGVQHDIGTVLATHVAADPTFATTKIGIQGDQGNAGAGKFAIPLTDHPNFKSPSGILDTEQARGISTRHDDEFNVVQTGDPAEFTAPFLGHAYNITGFLLSLFQTGQTGSGAEEAAHAGGVHNQTRFLPYVIADCVTFSYYTRAVQPTSGSDAIDLIIRGAITSSITFTGESGGVLNIEAAILGAAWETKDLTSLTTILENSFDIEQVLKYQDATIAFEDIYTRSNTLNDLTFDATAKTIATAAGDFTSNPDIESGDYIIIKGTALNDGRYLVTTSIALLITLDAGETLVNEGTADASAFIGGIDWIDVKTPNISFTIVNNVSFNYYNDDVAVSAHLGKLTVEGSITMPFSQTTVGTDYMVSRFLNGEQIRIAWYWGQSGSSPDIENDHDLGYGDASNEPDRYKNDSSATDPRNFFSMIINARCTDYELAGDNELMVECTIQAAKDSVYNAVEIYTVYDDTKLDWEA